MNVRALGFRLLAGTTMLALAVPGVGTAQNTAVDSSEVTRAIAASILLNLRGNNYRGPVAVLHPLAYEARVWTMRIHAVLAQEAPELLVDSRIRHALKLELESLTLTRDSVVVRAWFAQCTPARTGFNNWRNSVVYSIRRVNGTLVPIEARALVAADGYCDTTDPVIPPQAEKDRLRSRVVGCYAVERAAWDGPLPAAAPGVYDIPRMIRLDSAHTGVRTWPDSMGRRAYPSAPSVVASAHPREAFWFVANDTLDLVWTDGFVSAMLAVAIRDDSLPGDAAVSRMDVRVGATAPVLLRRISCAQFDAAEREQRRDWLLLRVKFEVQH